MSKLILASRFIFATFLIITIVSCSNQKVQEGTSIDTTVALSTNSELIDEAILKAPTPAEVPAIIEATGVDFDPTLVNAPDKYKMYTTTTDVAALNLGVYAEDVAYLSVFDKGMQSNSYLLAADKLARHLGIEESFGKDVQEKLEAYAGRKDSLSAFTNIRLQLAHKLLNTSQRQDLATYIGVGVFMEGLYQNTQLLAKYPKNMPVETREIVLLPLIKSLFSQLKPLHDLNMVLKTQKLTNKTTIIAAEMQTLENEMISFNFEEKMRNNKGDFKVNTQDLKSITDKTASIRLLITN